MDISVVFYLLQSNIFLVLHKIPLKIYWFEQIAKWLCKLENKSMCTKLSMLVHHFPLHTLLSTMNRPAHLLPIQWMTRTKFPVHHLGDFPASYRMDARGTRLRGKVAKLNHLHLDMMSRKKACSCMLSWHLVTKCNISYHTVDSVKCTRIRLQHTSTRAKPTNNWFIYITKKMCASCDNLEEKQGCPVQLLHTQFCTSNILFEGISEDLSNTKTQIFNGIVTSPRLWIE